MIRFGYIGKLLFLLLAIIINTRQYAPDRKVDILHVKIDITMAQY